MSTVSNDEVPILYELLVYEEWLQDPETLKSSCGSISPFTSLYPQKLFNCLRHPEWPSEELVNELSPLLPWHIALSPNGLMVAILQEGLLEVRTHGDDFTSTVGKAIIPKDEFPQLRILKWHPESSKIAISSSHGVVTIFDSFCSNLFTLPLPNKDKCKHSGKFYVAGIEFTDSENQKKNEQVVVVYSNGLIQSFVLSERDLHENHTFQLTVDQVSNAVYNQHFNILLVSSQPQPTTRYFQDSCFSAGISAWQMISEYPYYKMLFPSEEEFKMLRAGGKLWKIFNFSKLQGVAVKLSVSQNNQFLASLHCCHTIIIWLLPSLRMYRKWSTDFESDICPEAGIKMDSPPVDIGWRHDEKLIVSRRDGSISVHHIETFDVCYGSGSKLLSGYPRISSTKHFPGLITLECDTILLSPSTEDSFPDCEKSILDASSEMIQNTIYYITDIETFQPKKKSTKVIQKIYRMIGVKSTTPEELFWRKLDSNEYAGALELADEFGLNSDEVYKKLWRTSAVSSLSISENLSKIKNKSWVLNECVQRVPESISGAEDLLAFAFNITSKSNIFDDPASPENEFADPSFSCDALDQLQKEKIMTRIMLLNYADKLRAYKEILGGNPDIDGSYDMVQYDRFRKLPIVVSAIYFARQCDIRAVEVIFKYYASGVTPYWFSILDNIPEIFPPSEYSKLLPGCDEEGIPVYWEDCHSPTEDWAHNNVFSNLIQPLAQDGILKELELEPVLSMSGPMLSEWYRKRALEIESRSKLIMFAQSLVRIGIEKNIQGLCDLNSNFTTLECMVYELELDVDTYTFLNMTDLQKCIAMMEKTVPEDFTYRMLRYFVPFLNRHRMDHEKRYQLFFEFLTYTSHENLRASLFFLSYVLDENYDLIGGPEEITRLIVECIYSYNKFDLVHEIFEVVDSCISWIASQPRQTSELRNLLKKLNILREETFTAHVISGREISTTVKAVHTIKLVEDEPKRILQQIMSSVIKEYFKDKYISKVTDVLQDILSIQEMCFKKVRLSDCYEMYACELLNSNCLPLIELSSSVLCSKKEVENDCFLSFDNSVKLVLLAARKYFDCSESVDDGAMTLSKACLFLIKDDHDEINKEMDLIQALRYLKEIGVTLIPVQVRQSEDRMKLIHLCFEKNKELYRKSQFVYKLGGKLRVCGDDILLRHNMITEKLAQVSLADGAVSFCTEFCSDLVVNNYGKGWETVFELLKRTTVDYRPIVKVFWSFCAIHAPCRYLNDLFDVRKSINMNMAISQYEGFGMSEDTPVSLVNTPDSDNWDDYQLASSDSSHKLDEASDEIAESVPGYCSPFFYSNRCESPEYEVTVPQHFKHSIFQVVHVPTEESLFAFVEAHNFSVDPWIVDSKLIELGARNLNKDTLTALGFLLSANNPLSCEDFFDKLPQVTFAHELAAYYYAICSLRGSSESILKPPFEAVSDAITLEHSEFRLSIAKYAKKCESLTQAKSLKEENCGVNYERFMKDESYKTDTIYGLAMSPDKLGIAIELAKKNSIPIIDIVMTHIESMFFEDKVDHLIKTFSENSELALVVKSSITVVLDRLQSLFAIIDGADHKKLINFFKILQCMAVEWIINGLTAKEHIKLLKKIESTVPGLDYKDLVSQRKDLVSLLKPYLVHIETVGNCVKLAKSLPKNLKMDFSTSLLYFEFSLHQFHTLCSSCKSLKQCASHFETIYPSLAKLNQNELLEFVQRSICDKEIVMKLDYVIRRQLLNSLLQWCYGTNVVMRSNFDSVIQFIQEKLERLNIIWNDDDEEVSSNPSMKNYLCEVELYDPNDDLQNPKQLESLLQQAMLDCSLLKSEQNMLLRVIKALEPQSSHFDTLSLESSLPEDTDDDIHQLPIPNPGNTPTNEFQKKLEAVKQFCEKVVTNYYTSRPPTSFNYEILADTEITPSMLNYMFLPEIAELGSVSEVSWSVVGMYYSKYDVAMTVIKANLPPPTFQKLAQLVMEAFDSNDTDKVFLVWLCLSCEQLNLHDHGDSFLKSQIMADHLVHYVASHPESAERLVPRLILTNKFADIASTLLGEGDTMTVLSLIKALKISGMSAEAGTLMMSSSRVPASLKTFDSSLWSPALQVYDLYGSNRNDCLKRHMSRIPQWRSPSGLITMAAPDHPHDHPQESVPQGTQGQPSDRSQEVQVYAVQLRHP